MSSAYTAKLTTGARARLIGMGLGMLILCSIVQQWYVLSGPCKIPRQPS